MGFRDATHHGAAVPPHTISLSATPQVFCCAECLCWLLRESLPREITGSESSAKSDGESILEVRLTDMLQRINRRHGSMVCNLKVNFAQP